MSLSKFQLLHTYQYIITNLFVFFKISWKSYIKPFVLTYGWKITENIRAYKNLQNQNDKKEIKCNHIQQCMKYFSWIMLVWEIPHRVVIRSVRHWYEYCINWFRFLWQTIMTEKVRYMFKMVHIIPANYSWNRVPVFVWDMTLLYAWISELFINCYYTIL